MKKLSIAAGRRQHQRARISRKRGFESLRLPSHHKIYGGAAKVATQQPRTMNEAQVRVSFE